MPFDLSTARPVEASAPPPSGGFDLSTAQPVQLATAQGFVASNPAEYDPSSPAYQAKYGATAGSSFLDNLRAGFGEGLVNLGRGVGQTLGLESRQAVAQSRAQDAALNATWGGKIGNIAGNVAATLPALAIPGAATIPGAAAVGGALGFLQPSTSTKETLLNTGVGAASGAAGQWVGNKISGAVEGRLADRTAAAADEQSLNAARDAVLKQSREAGYVIPPTAVNPSLTATAAESISGKAATRQAAEAINAKVSNRLVAEDLGLAANRPITQDALQAVRTAAGKVYGQVAAVGKIAADQPYLDELAKIGATGSDIEAAYPGIGAQAGEKVQSLLKSLAQPEVDASQALSAFRFLNERAKAGFKAAFAKGGDVELLDVARAQKDAADALGELIQRNLEASGNGALGQAWQEARTTIAKTYTAEAALKGGNINAIQLAAQLRKGAPLSGGFKQVAEFGDMFGEAARVPKSGVGVSKLAAVTGGGGALYALATGHPAVAAAAAAGTAIPWGVRKAMLSGLGQTALATPSYAPNMLGTLGLNAIGGAARYGSLPAYLATSQLAAQADEQNPPQPR